MWYHRLEVLWLNRYFLLACWILKPGLFPHLHVLAVDVFAYSFVCYSWVPWFRSLITPLSPLLWSSGFLSFICQFSPLTESSFGLLTFYSWMLSFFILILFIFKKRHTQSALLSPNSPECSVSLPSKQNSVHNASVDLLPGIKKNKSTTMTN